MVVACDEEFTDSKILYDIDEKMLPNFGKIYINTSLECVVKGANIYCCLPNLRKEFQWNLIKFKSIFTIIFVLKYINTYIFIFWLLNYIALFLKIYNYIFFYYIIINIYTKNIINNIK